MILGFKQQYPWGGPTYFEEKILQGVGIQVPNSPTMQVKLHTIRGENCRIQPGDALHMAYGVRTTHYRQFNKDIEPLAVCKGRQKIEMHRKKIDEETNCTIIWVDNDMIEFPLQLIENDGLIFSQFVDWFFPKGTGTFTGYIIHWTDLKY